MHICIYIYIYIYAYIHICLFVFNENRAKTCRYGSLFSFIGLFCYMYRHSERLTAFATVTELKRLVWVSFYLYWVSFDIHVLCIGILRGSRVDTFLVWVSF